MKLAELITPIEAKSLEAGYMHMSIEERANILQIIRTAIEDAVSTHVDALPYPKSLSEAYTPQEIVVVPAIVQDIVISYLDDLVDEAMVVEKIALYFTICRDIGHAVLLLYEVGWKRAMKRLGADPDELEVRIERLKREN